MACWCLRSEGETRSNWSFRRGSAREGQDRLRMTRNNPLLRGHALKAAGFIHNCFGGRASWFRNTSRDRRHSSFSQKLTEVASYRFLKIFLLKWPNEILDCLILSENLTPRLFVPIELRIENHWGCKTCLPGADARR